MIPASHVLTGYLAGRAVRLGLRLDSAPRNPLRDPITLTAVAGSVFPDWDVLPGLLGGYLAAGFHRGATHSPVGVLLQALLLGAVAHRLFQSRLAQRWWGSSDRALSLKPLTLAALLGLASHSFWDSMNPWGVALLWPFRREGSSAQLVHESDLWIFAILTVSAGLALAGRLRSGLLVAGLLIPAYLFYQFAGHAEVRQRATRELASERFKVYPTAKLSCPWLVLSESQSVLTARCSSGLGADRWTVAKEVRVVSHPAVSATEQLPEVQDILATRDFPFAEVREQPCGDTFVIWRGLREAALEDPSSPPSGLYVAVTRAGEIESVKHRWLLPVWLW